MFNQLFMSKKLRLLMILGDLLRLNFQKLAADSEHDRADSSNQKKKQSNLSEENEQTIWFAVILHKKYIKSVL